MRIVRLVGVVVLWLLQILIAVAFVRLLWPTFSALSGRAIPLGFMLQPDFWLLVGTLFAGEAL